MAKEKKKIMEEDFPDERKFLRKTELIVSYAGTQLSIENAGSLWKIVEQMGAEIIRDTPLKHKLIRISNKIALMIAQRSPLDAQSIFIDGIAKIRAEVEAISLESIEIEDDVSVEMIFPNVTMQIIQKLKKHPLVNHKKTCSCMACIRVYLV